MNLYSNKQKWKIALLILALLTVGASLFVSNQIVSKVGEREKERAQQWADAIRKKIELVRLTNNTFDSLRAKEREKMALWVEATEEASKKGPLNQDFGSEFPLRIIQNNTDIPVIAVDVDGYISANRNLDFDTSDIRKIYPDASKHELMNHFDDSLLVLSEHWKKKNPSFTVEVFDNYYITYCYNDSKAIDSLENVRDSLIESFNRELIDNEGLMPVLLIGAQSREIIGTNIPEAQNSKVATSEITGTLNTQPIVVDFNSGEKNLLYYGDSPELRQLKYFPFIQFTVIGLFAFIGYLIFSTFRKAEQNQVWAGMAKETAHQLGTPLSSLMAWIQYLETQDADPMIVTEMQKDVNRLEKVTDRFSKIGSGAKLDAGDVAATVRNVMSYLQPRISDKVQITVNADNALKVEHNASLIEWVVENIAKNAVDAMEGEGALFVTAKEEDNWVHIDIRDTGKGIPPNQLKTIFQPGFSTKKRGWGLGLSLVRRIVKEYHKGKVFVLESQLNVGTTFRISLPK